MPYLIIGIVIVLIIFWRLSGARALSRNEMLYLKRRGYAQESDEPRRPVERDTRLLGLIDSLSDISPYSRQRAAEEIGALCRSGQKDERMFSALVAALEDSQPAVRTAAARALGELGDGRAIEKLNARLEIEEAIQTQAAIKQMIEKLGANHPQSQIDSL
ncbi:MAG: HEAT repeat domain-containing protein [Acidobacteriota bacterium]